MNQEPYFQFPLCALAFGRTTGERLNMIIEYAVVEAGLKLYQKLPYEQQRGFLAGLTINRRNPGGINPNDPIQCGALYGAHAMGVTYPNYNRDWQRHRGLSDYIAAYERKHGKDARVRVKKAWLFNTRDHHGLAYREFIVLCAIYSAIGDKKFTGVTREVIRRRALGYRTAVIMQAELPRRADTAQPLTERQLRDTIARLHRNKFFARCTYARRVTYYSIRLDDTALRSSVIDKHTYKEFFHAKQSAKDQTMTAEIKRKRREIATGKL